jgi:hypothetical protein
VNPASVLQERFPLADFSIYFRHLAACRTAKGLNTQDHHICPKKQFPEYRYEPENLITLTREDHAHAHRLLVAAVPELSNVASLIEAGDQSKAGKIGGLTNAKSGHIQRISALVRTREHQAKAGRAGGRKGGPASVAIQKKNRTGFYGITPERRRTFSAKGGRSPIPMHVRWHVKRGITSPTCALCASAS